MAATEFKVVSWTEEVVSVDKLEAMVSNDNWIKTKMTQSFYSAFSKKRDEGIRIASGLVLITARKSASASKTVQFGEFFSPGCRPIVTTGTVSKAQRKIWVTIDGPGNELHPTSDGFQVHVVVNASSKKNKKISPNFYVAWHALGY